MTHPDWHKADIPHRTPASWVLEQSSGDENMSDELIAAIERRAHENVSHFLFWPKSTYSLTEVAELIAVPPAEVPHAVRLADPTFRFENMDDYDRSTVLRVALDRGSWTAEDIAAVTLERAAADSPDEIDGSAAAEERQEARSGSCGWHVQTITPQHAARFAQTLLGLIRRDSLELIYCALSASSVMIGDFGDDVVDSIMSAEDEIVRRIEKAIRPALEREFTNAAGAVLKIDVADLKDDRRKACMSHLRDLWLKPRPSYSATELATIFNTTAAYVKMMMEGSGTSPYPRDTVLQYATCFIGPVELSEALGDDSERFGHGHRLDEPLLVRLPIWMANAIRDAAEKRNRTVSETIAYELLECHTGGETSNFAESMERFAPACCVTAQHHGDIPGMGKKVSRDAEKKSLARNTSTTRAKLAPPLKKSTKPARSLSARPRASRS